MKFKQNFVLRAGPTRGTNPDFALAGLQVKTTCLMGGRTFYKVGVGWLGLSGLQKDPKKYENFLKF